MVIVSGSDSVSLSGVWGVPESACLLTFGSAGNAITIGDSRNPPSAVPPPPDPEPPVFRPVCVMCAHRWKLSVLSCVVLGCALQSWLLGVSPRSTGPVVVRLAAMAILRERSEELPV